MISVGGSGIIKTNPMDPIKGSNYNVTANLQQQSNSKPSSSSQQRPISNLTSTSSSTSNVTINSQQSGSNTISNTQNSSSNAAFNSQQSIKNSTSDSSQSTSNSTQSTFNSTSDSQQSYSNDTSDPNQPLQNESNPAVESLKKNIRFASRTDSAALLRNAVKQTPKLYWIGCSDSRVSETLLIEAELGEVFTERNIANLFKAEDARTSAGMEYAIHALNISHVVLVGHEGCGGCVTALASAREEATGNASAGKLSVGEEAIVNWIAPIRQMAVDMLQRIAGTSAYKSPTPQEYRKQLSTLVELNVFQQARNILNSPVVKDAKRLGRAIWVYGWIYDIETGKIKQVFSEYSS
ncbi:carbonic anhydrase [Melampsora americana]|nr:carbonic anhydrase [Melampsora americana]